MAGGKSNDHDYKPRFFCTCSGSLAPLKGFSSVPKKLLNWLFSWAQPVRGGQDGLVKIAQPERCKASASHWCPLVFQPDEGELKGRSGVQFDIASLNQKPKIKKVYKLP